MMHKELEVWKISMELAEKIYHVTASFPKEEIFGLTNQMRRCAVSIPSNIAEGAAKSSIKEFIKYLYVSRGSLSELETQIILCERLKYLKSNELQQFIEKIGKLLSGMIKSQKLYL
jgi:four helix bundle protein